MTDEQLQRIHDIEYSCDSRAELAERIVALEDELTEWERLTAGVELPEYPISQFQPKDLERENTKLRKLAVGMYGMLEMLDKMLGNHDACETPRPLIFGEDKSFKDVMREQGIEVES